MSDEKLHAIVARIKELARQSGDYGMSPHICFEVLHRFWKRAAAEIG